MLEAGLAGGVLGCLAGIIWAWEAEAVFWGLAFGFVAFVLSALLLVTHS